MNTDQNRMRYVPYEQSSSIPNIIVDGSANASTLLTLSHWPHSGTPWPLKADLSAQIAFRYLDHPPFHVSVEAVSNNHFDEDGLVSMFVMIHPEAALAQRDLLIDIASAGDFGTFRSHEAARIAFIISAFADAETSPLSSTIFNRPYPEITAALYQDLVARFPEILTNPTKYREFYEQPDNELQQSEANIRSGKIRIEEVPSVDLAIVCVAEGHSAHPMALHNATGCFRILTIEGRKVEFRYRYETWVQYISTRPIPRVDLEPLAERLSQQDQTAWEFEGVEAITPSLFPVAGESAIDPEKIVRQFTDFLSSAPAAWNPFDPV